MLAIRLARFGKKKMPGYRIVITDKRRPRNGRFVEIVGTYNPRTGISTETDRHYGEDSNKMKMDRTIEGPGGREMDVKKRTDFDTGTRTTERTTNTGGKSEVTRQRQAGGGFTTEGTVKTGDGRTATISGEHERGKGSTTITGSEGGSAQIDRERNRDGSVSREGSFSKDGQTIDTETRRDGRQSITKAEGSGGGQAISVKDGPGDRTAGSGLGLSIVKAIVERHGATITASSVTGEGTVFAIKFPAERPIHA